MPIPIQTDLALLALHFPVSADEVKRAYRIMAKKWHPDRHPAAAQAAAVKKMAEINQAKGRIDQYLARYPTMGMAAASAQGVSASAAWVHPRDELAQARRIFEEQVARGVFDGHRVRAKPVTKPKPKPKPPVQARPKAPEGNGYADLLRAIRETP